MNFTLVNYPLRSFTRQELMDLQDRGIKFESRSDKLYSWDTGKRWFYMSYGEYRVEASTTNIALFEKLAGIPTKKTPRKHHELIKAWAEDDSLKFQVKDFDGVWVDLMNSPQWNPDTDYRIKPCISEQTLKDIQQGLTTGFATCLGMLILKEEI